MSELSNQEQIQQTRIEKGKRYSEIELLEGLSPRIKTTYRKTPGGLIIQATLELEPFPVRFDLLLEGKFPFQPPRLLCETMLGFPSFSDGRDLIQVSLNRKWVPSITSVDILESLPRVLSTVSEDPTGYGVFTLEEVFSFSTWENKEGMELYMCKEIDSDGVMKEKAFVVTHTCILQLDLIPDSPQTGVLTSWATLQSLKSIQQSKNDTEKLTFEWKAIGEDEPFSQMFKMTDANDCIALITENSNKLTIQPQMIREEDVTIKAVQKIDITHILQTIDELEKQTQEEFNIDTINKLIEMYQCAVEFFSAIDDPRYDEMLGKTHDLLANDRVQELLAAN